MKLKRSQQKKVTHEARVIRHMRFAKGISLKEAGRRVRISGSAIAHIEQGRIDISRERLKTLIAAYGYTMDEYLEYFDGKPLPTQYRDECIHMLNSLDEVRLQTVHAVICGFVNVPMPLRGRQ